LTIDRLRRIDARLTARLQSAAVGRGRRTILSITAHSGDSAIIIPAFGVLWAVDGFSLQSYVLSLAAAFAGTVVLTSALKWGFRRGRPKGDWGGLYRRTDPHSFPSGHASRTVALCLTAFGRHWPLAGALLLLWSLLVGYARVAMGVHYVLDVLAGYLLGAAVGVAAWLLTSQGLLP
jgi:membrane-associated phospholipid phosphatase